MNTRCIPTIVLALLPAAAAHALSPPDLRQDIAWAPDVFGSTATAVDDIAAAFDAGRRGEERQFGLDEGSLGTLTLPSADEWAAMDEAARALLIVNAERIARGGVAYPDGAPLGLPLAGVERHLDRLAQDYADYMVANDFWGHRAPDDGSPRFAGTDPFGRIDAAEVIGEGAGANGQDCHEFLGQAENLALHAVTGDGDIPLLVERSLYGFLYADSGSDWGHRRLLLLQNEPLEGVGGGFLNDAGSADSEGFLGLGTAGARDGSYSVLDGARSYAVQSNVVLLMIDPVADADCGYDVIGTSPTETVD